jgi:ABC-2 type transport system permease protein
MTTLRQMLRLLGITWWLQVKIRSRSAFDGLLSLVWPLFFATTIFLLYRAGHQAPAALLSAAVGAAVMGIWSATSTTASAALQNERQQGTLELLVAAPTPLPLLLIPVTLSMATVGLYSMVTTLLWGRFVFGISLHVHSPVVFVVAVLVVVISIGMFGFLLAVGSVRYRSAWAVGAGLEMPIWFICGFLVPLSALPTWVRPISWLLAPTWGMTAVRHAALGGSTGPAIAACLGLTAAYAVGGSYLAGRLVNAARARATLALT